MPLFPRLAEAKGDGAVRRHGPRTDVRVIALETRRRQD